MGDASDPNHKLAHFSWQLSIEGPREVANYTIDKQQVSCWYISDEFWNENRHWMTGAQLKEMKPNLEKALQQIGYTGGYKIYAYRWDGTGTKYRDPVEVTDAMGDAAKYSQFRILFYGSTTAEQNISFEYTTTVDVGTGKSDVSVTNWVSVNNQASVQPSQKYAPLVVKKDKVDNTAEDTYHDFDNAHLPAKGAGILGWDVSVKIPDMYYSDDFVITENLPEGTKLLDPEHGEWHLSFGVRDTNIGGEPLWFRDNVKTITRKVKPSTVEYTITITKVSDTVYTIKLPAGLANELGGKECFMEVRVQIDDKIDWTTASKKFTNTVTVTHGGAELGQGTQSQIIRNPVLTKTSAGPDSANGVSYTVEFNAGGRDYVPGSDTLTLTDTLTIGAADLADVNAALNLGNIKVYRVEQDQTTTDISADCPVTVADDAVVNGKLQKTFSMTVPDSTHIRVEYKYYLTGTTNTNVQLTNEAVIAGASDSVDEEENRIEVTIKESNAGAAVVGVTLKKVDEENYNILLQGAVFELRKWVPNNDQNAESKGEYVFVETFTTDGNGVFSTGELETDVAYQLQEISSPMGYAVDPIPYTFYIAGESTVVTSPENFDGEVLQNGQTIIISNQKTKLVLPETGFTGWGAEIYQMGGAAVSAAAAIGLLYKKRRKKGGQDPS